MADLDMADLDMADLDMADLDMTDLEWRPLAIVPKHFIIMRLFGRKHGEFKPLDHGFMPHSHEAYNYSEAEEAAFKPPGHTDRAMPASSTHSTTNSRDCAAP